MFPACSLHFTVASALSFVIQPQIAGFCGFRRANLIAWLNYWEIIYEHRSGEANDARKPKVKLSRNILGLLLGMNSPLRHWSLELSTNSNEIAFFCCRSDGEIIMNCDIFIGSVSDWEACKNACPVWRLWGRDRIMGHSRCSFKLRSMALY